MGWNHEEDDDINPTHVGMNRSMFSFMLFFLH